MCLYVETRQLWASFLGYCLLVLRQDLSLVQMPVYLAQGIPGILTFPFRSTGIVDAWCSTSGFVFFFFFKSVLEVKIRSLHFIN